MGEKYSEAIRQFCFNVFNYSPSAFNFLRTFFSNHLPNEGTIRSWFANSDLNGEPNSINQQSLNMLRIKATEKAENGEKLICSVVFDEMSIRKHFQWSEKGNQLGGFSLTKSNDNEEESLEESQGPDMKKIANQALVFIVCGVNDSFQIPISYYFINSLDAVAKKDIVERILTAIIECNIIVSNITFDGCSVNKAMCRLFGAVLDVYSSEFKPHFVVKGQRICIFFDACHMQKLVRGKFATKELFDGNGNPIKWQYIVDLVDMKNRGFSLVHKLTQTHINWERRKMKVDLAVQTLSESTAASIDFLMKKGEPEFLGAEPTVRFVQIFNSLFDIFNSRGDQNDNPFKNALSIANASQVFDFFDQSIDYIKQLQVKGRSGRLFKVCKTTISTGFKGYIIDMTSLKMMFQDFVQDQLIITMIETRKLQQDPIEILFGQIRKKCGNNDNPTSEVFSSSFRNILAQRTVLNSKFANCESSDNISFSNPYSNILTITSRRKPVEKVSIEDYEGISEEQIELLYSKMSEIEAMESNRETDELSDHAIAQAAQLIESKISRTKHYTCELCAKIFIENTRKTDNLLVKPQLEPCHSTFLICKHADKFLKMMLLDGSMKFEVIYHEILRTLDFDELYFESDFETHLEHKVFLIRYVIDEYIKIKGRHIAKTLNVKEHGNSLRVKLNKLMHYLGC